jgi:ribose transport system ATP-binding protein
MTRLAHPSGSGDLVNGRDISDEGPALVLEHVSKTFPGTRALDDVALRLERGEIHALMGQNGSGKSTLIKVLAGFHSPDPGGKAEVGGEPLLLGHQGAARHAGVRFIHQDLGLVDGLDAADNLALGVGYLTGPGFRIQWRRQRRLAAEAIAALGHPFDVRRPVETLSAVERTTLAIARAVRDMEKVRVLVLDEPTAAMPASDVERLHAMLRRICDTGVAVLYVSHHLDEVLSLADRVTVLRDGHCVGTLPVEELTAQALVDWMTGGISDQAAESRSERIYADTVLAVDGLTSGALSGFSMEVRAGEVVGLAGIDGSGRDAVCGAVYGARPRAGSVQLAGTELPACRPDVSVRAGIGFVPAFRAVEGLITSMTVRENFTLTGLRPYVTMRGLSGRGERSDVRTWMQRLSVRAHSIEASIDQLSGGNQQKIVIGKWLRRDPKLLLLDEPTQGVDVAAKAELHLLVDEAAAAGAAVVVSSSDEAELERLCDRVIVLRRGLAPTVLDRSRLTATAIAHACLQSSPTADVAQDPDERPRGDTHHHPLQEMPTVEVVPHVPGN